MVTISPARNFPLAFTERGLPSLPRTETQLLINPLLHSSSARRRQACSQELIQPLTNGCTIHGEFASGGCAAFVRRLGPFVILEVGKIFVAIFAVFRLHVVAIRVGCFSINNNAPITTRKKLIAWVRDRAPDKIISRSPPR